MRKSKKVGLMMMNLRWMSRSRVRGIPHLRVPESLKFLLPLFLFFSSLSLSLSLPLLFPVQSCLARFIFIFIFIFCLKLGLTCGFALFYV